MIHFLEKRIVNTLVLVLWTYLLYLQPFDQVYLVELKVSLASSPAMYCDKDTSSEVLVEELASLSDIASSWLSSIPEPAADGDSLGPSP